MARQPIQRQPFSCSLLPCGLRVITADLSQMQSVAAGIWAGAGGRYESPELNGISHFLEHMNFKGTARRSARQISKAIESVGGNMNGFTSEESTCYYAKVCHTRFARALDVLLDLYAGSVFRESEVSKERQVIKEETRMYTDMHQQIVYEDLNAIMWPRHPLGRPLLGTFESLDRIGAPELRAYRDAHYVPANTVISVAGNIRHEDVVHMVRTNTVDWARRPAPAPMARFRPGQRAPRLHFRTRPIEQTHMVIGVRAFSRTAPERFALRMLSTILGENMSSRLNHEIRERRGLAYAVQSNVVRYFDTGALQIGVSSDPANAPRVLGLVLKICRDIAERGCRPAELRHAREFVRGNVALSLERTTDYMLWMGENLLTVNHVLTMDELLERFDSVSVADVQRVAATVFRDSRLSLALVTPEIDRAAIRDLVTF